MWGDGLETPFAAPVLWDALLDLPPASGGVCQCLGCFSLPDPQFPHQSLVLMFSLGSRGLQSGQFPCGGLLCGIWGWRVLGLHHFFFPGHPSSQRLIWGFPVMGYSPLQTDLFQVFPPMGHSCLFCDLGNFQYQVYTSNSAGVLICKHHSSGGRDACHGYAGIRLPCRAPERENQPQGRLSGDRAQSPNGL